MENNKNKTKVNERMAGKYLDPKADLTFKLVFGEHRDLAMSLLNALLPLADDEQIVELEYATPEMIPENPGKKNSVVDVRCTDQKGRQFIVEMQMYWNRYFQQRVILNASKAIVKQLDEKENYSLVKPVYCLNLVNDIGFKSAPEEFYHDYAIVNVAHSDRIIEGLRFIFIELPKFKPQNVAEKKMAVLWLRYLTEINRSTEEVPAELLENEQTRKAISLVEKSAMSEGQLYAYERFWMSIHDEEFHIETKYLEGIEEGREKERIENEKRRAEERLANARSLKENGVPLDIIAKSMSLTDEEIAQISQ